MALVQGIILKVNTFRKDFKMFYLFSDGQIITCILKGKRTTINKEDFICVNGDWVKKKEANEFHINEIVAQKKATVNPTVRNRLYDWRVMQNLYLRKKVVQTIHDFFAKRDFLPNQSPTITGDWVEGRTEAFQTMVYEENAYLSISNVIFHQICVARGFNKIYELGKLHRQERPSTPKKLAEFTILDITQTYVDTKEIMEIIEELICALHTMLNSLPLYKTQLIPQPAFEIIHCGELLKKCSVSRLHGSQLTKELRQYLHDYYDSFVWVLGFNKETRPFYIKANAAGECNDCQLWYQGVRYFAAGGEMETDYEMIVKRLRESGKNKKKYYFYLDYVKKGLPEISSIGLGLELLLSCMVQNTVAADFALFPKYKNNLKP